MNCKAKTTLSPGNNMAYQLQDDMTVFEDFLNTYCDKTFSTVARLTGTCDVSVITNVTTDIFAELWSKREKTLSKDNSCLLFKTILRHALLFLRRQKNEDRIELLRSILLCKEPFSVLEST
ncbi:hypothetical protein [Chitinophaga sp. 212800010-3]|uniref:hypothetical protein n=1 Tax=unclassified Chitinophaga TaxID=2619133 RepID=UPI002DE826A6|nr:Mediator of RNA polymerase II transcription subunit 24 [Chitinophaga sp. 212800010-3]